MKILLYSQNEKLFSKSGLGKAIKRQRMILEENNIPYTKDPKDTDYDILHTNTYLPKSYRVVKKARKKGKKILFHAHSTKEDFKNSFTGSNLVAPLFKWWIIKAYNLGDIIVTPTPYSKKLLLGYGIKKPIVDISNGIQLDFFEKNAEGGQLFREKYGYNPDDKVVMAVGLFLKRKGILDFVELAKKMPDHKFIWFGHTPLASVPRKIRKAVKTKLPNLTFAGYVEQQDLRQAYWGADLFLLMTYEETEGIPILESLAAKQRTLIRDIPIYSEWFEDGVHLYKARDNQEFEQKIRQLTSGELPDLSEQGYKMAAEKEISGVGKQLIDVYNKLMEKNTGDKR